MTANEARAIAKRNTRKIEVVLEQVGNEAKCGHFMTMVPKLTTDLVVELMKLGYKVSTITDPCGMEFTKIEWE